MLVETRAEKEEKTSRTQRLSRGARTGPLLEVVPLWLNLVGSRAGAGLRVRQPCLRTSDVLGPPPPPSRFFSYSFAHQFSFGWFSLCAKRHHIIGAHSDPLASPLGRGAILPSFLPHQIIEMVLYVFIYK